jgi:hypothetical protein
LIDLSEDDLKLLRSIAKTGGKKYTGGLIDRSRYTRLEMAGLLKGQTTNLSDVIYELLPAANDYIRN